jgi:S-methylmethionine-dependent homocysteine/selenocysteine methylase
VGDLHADFIAAGADIVITNTYSTTAQRFDEYVAGDRLEEIVGRAIAQAHRARDEAARPVLIAGSLPPFRGSYLADRVADYEVLVPGYEAAATLLAPHVDFLICETMTTLDEARAARDGAAAATDLPIWVAWTLQNHPPTALTNGTSFADAVAAVDADAYLINCTEPETVEAALPLLVAATDKPVGVYANAFDNLPPAWSLQSGDSLPPRREDFGSEAFTSHALACVEADARIIGGCCWIGPDKIAHLHAALGD